MTTFSGKELVFRHERCCEVGVAELDSGTLGPGQLLVEARYSLISQGTELANFTGLDPGTRQPGSWNCYPHRPGYACTGTVVATGPPTDGGPEFAIGDPVFAIANHARYGVADPATHPVVRLRADDDQRTLILCRMAAIAMTAIRKSSSVDLGGHAVVVGLGLVGYFAAQLLRLAGLDVLGIDAVAVRREAAAAAGLRVAEADAVGTSGCTGRAGWTGSTWRSRPPDRPQACASRSSSSATEVRSSCWARHGARRRRTRPT
jgi:threonine dehydrogenase-like Zn-dependent dehydrogenase